MILPNSSYCSARLLPFISIYNRFFLSLSRLLPLEAFLCVYTLLAVVLWLPETQSHRTRVKETKPNNNKQKRRMCSQSHNQGIMTKSQPKKVNCLQFIIKMNEFYLPFFENLLSSISNDKYHIIAETHAHERKIMTMVKTTENIIIEFRFWKITLDGCSTAITTATKLNVFRVSYVLRINLRHIFLFSSSSFHRTFQSFMFMCFAIAGAYVCHSLHRYHDITQNITYIKRNRKFFHEPHT